MSKLRKAATEYLHARYWVLRERELGPSANTLPTLLHAEDRLWRALSGETDIVKAVLATGGRIAALDAPASMHHSSPQIVPSTLRKPKRPTKPTKRSKRAKGKLRPRGTTRPKLKRKTLKTNTGGLFSGN